MTLPLEHLRVLDLTQAMAGPFCTMILGDMGADVVKIEPPSGEVSRRAMGFKGKGDDTAAFIAINRNKRSLTLDLKSEEGRELFYALAREADVICENFRPGVTSRLGIDPDTIHGINPRLVYASISGFGQTGPHSQRAGFDLIAQGMAGVMSITGEPGGDPVKSGIPLSDLGAGLYCAFGVLSAVMVAERTGRGQAIDTSLFEAALSLGIWETAELWTTGRVPQPTGSAHRLTAPYQAYRTSDGYLTVGGNNHKLWVSFCEAIGRHDFIEDERFATNEDRMANRQELEHEVEAVLQKRTTEEWMEVMGEHGVPAGPIYNYAEVFEDPHTIERGMLEQYEHPVEGTVNTLGLPLKLSETPGAIRRHAPLVGEHTAEVLREVGVDDERLAALRQSEVV
ncbi:CoA transferase [Egibacter rhizosphaerae]|uniref:CoA transferase n=1 Tax=Egibacter rhizosphaerae TaxID=1670831 RepID=A0A411YBM5_9ACTN|nr:CoA transferase [Egibacter rhizosphaerae]QBI18572.1 CoA transferase [Egibacter rhizosphaerae]